MEEEALEHVRKGDLEDREHRRTRRRLDALVAERLQAEANEAGGGGGEQQQPLVGLWSASKPAFICSGASASVAHHSAIESGVKTAVESKAETWLTAVHEAAFERRVQTGIAPASTADASEAATPTAYEVEAWPDSVATEANEGCVISRTPAASSAKTTAKMAPQTRRGSARRMRRHRADVHDRRGVPSGRAIATHQKSMKPQYSALRRNSTRGGRRAEESCVHWTAGASPPWSMSTESSLTGDGGGDGGRTVLRWR